MRGRNAGEVVSRKPKEGRAGLASHSGQLELRIITLDGTGDLVVKRGGGGRGDSEWVQGD